MLDVRRLRLLSELSRRGTIAEVAKAVGYSASAVSQSLAQLEREAGMALLERDGRNVRLNAAARRLVVRADRVLAELDAAESELAAEHGGVRGEVVIGAFPSAAAHLVVPAVATLHERHPELHLPRPRARARGRDPAAALGRARPARSPRATTTSPPPPPAASSAASCSPSRCCWSATRAASSPSTCATLADAPWIGGTEQFAGALERAFQAAGFTPRIVHRADEATVFQALAAAGLGVGLLPALACSPAPGVHYARVTPEPPRRHITALLRRGTAARPALAATLEALRA